MSEVLKLILENNAGEIIYIHPLPKERFKEKAWRTTLELNGEWARRALGLEFESVSQAFRERGYEETIGWPSDWKHFSDIYVFAPNEGGLVRGIIQLARDYNMDPRIEDIVPYYDTNIDKKEQQDFLIEKVVEYIEVVNSLLES